MNSIDFETNHDSILIVLFYFVGIFIIIINIICLSSIANKRVH